MPPRRLFGREGGGRGTTPATAVTSRGHHNAKRKKIPNLLILLVVFGGLLFWQGSRPLHRSSAMYYSSTSTSEIDNILSALSSSMAAASSSSSTTAADGGPLGIPAGEGVAMPNDRNVYDADIDALRQSKQLGGVGDALHLGGFARNHNLGTGVSPAVWKHMVTQFNIKSVLDLGCGRGFATAWFDTHGVKTRGVDGSADALEHSAIPADRRAAVLVEHDFARGPW